MRLPRPGYRPLDRSGAIPQSILNTMAQRILTEMFRFDLSASTAVVVVSDDPESEATDRPSLNLPSARIS